MPNKILILFAHPLFEKSNANQALVRHIPKSENITFRDLYELYPDFDIDVRAEQEILAKHDIIIWHHPMYWYSCPPLLKQWIDLVLEHGWAYGSKGKELIGKRIFQVITTGGKKENYTPQGKDHFTITQLLEPFCQTARVCNMHYLPPFIVHGTHFMEAEEMESFGRLYAGLLNYIEQDDIDMSELHGCRYLNDWLRNKLL